MDEMFIGVDPGTNGAMSALDEDGNYLGGFMFKDKTDSDIFEGACLFLDLKPKRVFAFVESVHSMPGQGVSSTFKFGRSFGLITGILTAMKIRKEFVTPIKWQTAMNCRSGGNKNITKAAAQNLFPNIKITHGNADSLLLAEFCRRTWNSREKTEVTK